METASVINEYETHLTVSLSDTASVSPLQKWAMAHGMKCTHILLDCGMNISQPMLTRHGHGTLSEELATASEISRELNKTRFLVTRIKIETPPWGQGVPNSAEEALTRPPCQYFEHHVKVLLGPSATTKDLTERVQRHGARLSRNALKQREDGNQERFITQRCASVGRSEAHQQLETLLDAITLLGYPILDTEEEYVVYDSHLELDAGWMYPEE